MALTYCHECGEQISNTTKRCPKCGAKASFFGQVIAENRVREGLPPAKPIEEQQADSRRGAWLALCLIAVAIGAGAYLNRREEKEQERVDAQAARAYAALQRLPSTPPRPLYRRVFVDTATGLACGLVSGERPNGTYVDEDYWLTVSPDSALSESSTAKWSAQRLRQIEDRWERCSSASPNVVKVVP